MPMGFASLSTALSIRCCCAVKGWPVAAAVSILAQGLAVALHHRVDVVGHARYQLWVSHHLLLCGALHGGDLTIEVRVGLLADAARHEDDDIGFLNGFYHECSERFEHARYALGIVFIHLASEGVDAERKPIDG